MAMSNERESALDDLDQDEHQDVRTTQYRKDKMVAGEDAYVLDSDDEDDELSPYAPRRFHNEIEDDMQRPPARKRVGIMDVYGKACPAASKRLKSMGEPSPCSPGSKGLDSMHEDDTATLTAPKKPMKEGQSVASYLATLGRRI